MERGYGSAGDYLYPPYGPPVSEDSSNNDNHPNMSSDILQNFPYLRHGFNFGSHGQVSSSSSHHDSSRNSLNYKNAGYQQGFSQMSGSHVPNLGNVSPFQSYMSSSHTPHGMLPSVSTFTSALQQSTLSSQFHPTISDACDVQGQDTASYVHKPYRYHPGASSRSDPQSNSLQGSQSSPLPGFQNLASMSSSMRDDQHRPSYSSSVQSSSLHSTSNDTPDMRSVQQVNSQRSSHIQHSNVRSRQLVSSFSQEPVNSSSNFYNLVNHAVKMAPVQIPEEGQEKELDYGKNNILNSNTESVLTEKHARDTGKVKKVEHVKFYLKGRLSHVKLPVICPRPWETIDCTDSMYPFSMNDSNMASNNKVSRQKGSKTQTSRVTQNKKVEKTYKEPSIAEIRASVDKLNKGKELTNSQTNVLIDSIKEECEYSEDETMKGFSLGGEGNMHETWYSAAMKKYNGIKRDEEEEETLDLEPTVKKGGRSDPENPFAITSPSFSASAARALMTTTNSSTATTVRISIMSIGSRKKLLPSIVNSQAAHGGIVSVVNPIDTDSKTDGLSDSEVKSEKMSIMSKLKRDRQEKKDQQEEEIDTEIDRLDIDIKIDDDQYIGEGTQKRWQCKICPKSYTTKHNLLAHILDHSCIKPHLCLVCGKYFKQLSHLNTHMLTHDHIKPYKCTQCGKGFTQISHLKRHETVHLASKPYICDICNRGFAYPSELRIHKDKHIYGKEKCTDCDREFNTVEELKEHMAAEKHGDELTCKHCHRMFKYPSQLRDHMMSHGGPRPFICTECGMDFMKEHHLKAHLFTHTGLRPYSCPHCHRAFNQKANMVRHMLIHESERAFKCEICSKTFTQPQTLKAHMVVHSDKKPYSCRFCGKQFGRQHNLQGHLHIHLDSKPYICSICQASFTLKGNLNRHKKVKHGLNESTENMEEDAVNFLSSFSDRSRDVGSSDLDPDTNSLDCKSSKKGRKSIPKKRVTQRTVGEREEETEGVETRSDTEEDNSITVSYSDEERENEERLSKYFAEEEEDNPRRKRKGAAVVKNKDGGDDDDDDDGDSTEIEAEFENEAENDSEVEDDNDSDEFNIANGGRRVEESESGSLHDVVPEKRSMRKRKKKELDEDFLDYDENTEEEFDEPERKSARRKGAKLDTIIAAKFKSF